MRDDSELVAGTGEQAAVAIGAADHDVGSPTGGLTTIRNAASTVKELNILIALIALSTFLSFASPYFLTADNALGVARAFSLTAIAAIGQTMVIITGGIDLSAGSIIGLSSLSAGLLLVNGWP